MEAQNKILEYYRYIYYKMYLLLLRWWGESDQPQHTALMGVSLGLIAFFFNFLLIIHILFDYQINFYVFNKAQQFIGLVSLGLIHYYIFLHNNRLEKIKAHFQKRTYKSFFFREVFPYLFCFGSIILFVSILLITVAINS